MCILIILSVVVIIVCLSLLYRQYISQETPTSKCLKLCDTVLNKCYNECNGDEQCVKKCYEAKAKCYMDCLDNTSVKTCLKNCGC